MKKSEAKKLAQDLIMHQISIIGYGVKYEKYVKQIGNQEEADKILMEQMDRVAKLFGELSAWFS